MTKMENEIEKFVTMKINDDIPPAPKDFMDEVDKMDEEKLLADYIKEMETMRADEHKYWVLAMEKNLEEEEKIIADMVHYYQTQIEKKE